MKDNTITLRGHHLKILYQYYVLGHPLRSIEESLTEVYNKEHAKRAVSVLSKIVDDKGCQIIFTNSLDNICLGETFGAKCPRYKEQCSDLNIANEDERHIKKYELEIGKPYSSEEILKKLKEIDGSFMFELFG